MTTDKNKGVNAGHELFEASRASREQATDDVLAKTGTGRGGLRYRALKGDRDARAALNASDRREVDEDMRAAAEGS